MNNNFQRNFPHKGEQEPYFFLDTIINDLKNHEININQIYRENINFAYKEYINGTSKKQYNDNDNF